MNQNSTFAIFWHSFTCLFAVFDEIKLPFQLKVVFFDHSVLPIYSRYFRTYLPRMTRAAWIQKRPTEMHVPNRHIENTVVAKHCVVNSVRLEKLSSLTMLLRCTGALGWLARLFWSRAALFLIDYNFCGAEFFLVLLMVIEKKYVRTYSFSPNLC